MVASLITYIHHRAQCLAYRKCSERKMRKVILFTRKCLWERINFTDKDREFEFCCLTTKVGDFGRLLLALPLTFIWLLWKIHSLKPWALPWSLSATPTKSLMSKSKLPETSKRTFQLRNWNFWWGRRTGNNIDPPKHDWRQGDRKGTQNKK